MKTTIDIPEQELLDVLSFTNAKTKREAIVIAIKEYNRRKKMAALARHLGSCTQLTSPEELSQLREKD